MNAFQAYGQALAHACREFARKFRANRAVAYRESLERFERDFNPDGSRKAPAEAEAHE